MNPFYFAIIEAVIAAIAGFLIVTELGLTDALQIAIVVSVASTIVTRLFPGGA